MNRETLNKYIVQSLYKWLRDRLDDYATSDLLSVKIGWFGAGRPEDIKNPVIWLQKISERRSTEFHGSGADNRESNSLWEIGFIFGSRQGKKASEDYDLYVRLEGRIRDILEGDVQNSTIENALVGAKLYSWDQTVDPPAIVDEIGFCAFSAVNSRNLQPSGANLGSKYSAVFTFNLTAAF